MPSTSTRPTLKEVAQRAGVSTAAVSYVLSGRAEAMRISAACVKRVLAAAKIVGYRANYHARTLSVGKSYTLGLAVGAEHSILGTWYWGHIAAGVESAARERGYDLLLIGGTTTDQPLTRAATYLEERRIEGLVILSSLHPEVPAQILRRDQPVVFIERHDKSASARVNLDPRPGIEAAVQHLAALGHRDIVWLQTASRAEPIFRLRRETFLAAAKSAGVIPREVFVPPILVPGLGEQSSVVHAHASLAAGMTLPKTSTAVICQNDNHAIALQTLLCQRGVRVPEDLSVIGFDDAVAMDTVPTLTTVSHRLDDLGRKAVELAMDLVEGRPRPKTATLVPATLTVRSSTAPPRA